MISLEYINVHHQENTTSYALKSHRLDGENPSLVITKENGAVIWELINLRVGEVQEIEGAPRKSRIDFYVGLEDLINHRDEFPNSNGNSAGLKKPITIPTGTEREGGKNVKWKTAIGRTIIEDVNIKIPPFSLTKSPDESIYFNVDGEYAYYPIKGESGKSTTLELHFGVQHNYNVSRDNEEEIKVTLTMNEDQYATILEFIDKNIEWYENT